MTPLTWLTIYYQAACRQHSVESHQTDPVTTSDRCVLQPDGASAVCKEENVENAVGSSSDVSASVAKQRANCGCSDCFLHVPQYSQQAYLQIVRVSLRFLRIFLGT